MSAMNRYKYCVHSNRPKKTRVNHSKFYIYIYENEISLHNYIFNPCPKYKWNISLNYDVYITYILLASYNEWTMNISQKFGPQKPNILIINFSEVFSVVSCLDGERCFFKTITNVLSRSIWFWNKNTVNTVQTE